jgi:hypothetical protein
VGKEEGCLCIGAEHPGRRSCHTCLCSVSPRLVHGAWEFKVCHSTP